MSADVVISAEGLGKKYIIGHKLRSRETTLRDTLVRSLATLNRRTLDLVRGKPLISGDEIEEFWALREVDFEINRGDVIGIIGANGAGKSTLLKVLSRITEPSAGRVQIKGRVASLLEVGTGFHPELTGRENVYLNGAILGMKRAEIKRKFDEIVDFAGVEKFLDTPVKRYSSGMYVRLAFAVAAHLEPEILIVDEVLAVGDAEFQQKCFGKMRETASSGRTVLLVSHNVNAISALCEKCLWLDAGQVQKFGSRQETLSAYAMNSAGETGIERSFSLDSINGTFAAEVNYQEGSLTCNLTLSIDRSLTIKAAHFFIQTSAGMRVGIIDLLPVSEPTVRLSPGDHSLVKKVDITDLSQDIFQVGFHLVTNRGDFTEWSADKLLISNQASRYPVEYQGPIMLRDLPHA